ncbi:short-chain dehydrogenase/reductase [Ahniella affigens]|uniref:Short-chain dehydrogenase/reductase n=1 Tax=Ahniella affigens TaxID=2021234 RepID=A0A2P1PNA2_9GAMM|nr:oxidoreductase [Ahniella affigens]AVP96312.1 short-chain dehydrogenase/reductase [Ahniella affigens]
MNNTHPIALVTGASSGIGRVTAEQLALAGYKVYGTSRTRTATAPPSFETLILDVNSDDSVNAAVAELIRREGRIDLLVNNAGFGIAPAGAEESSMAQARAIFDTNFFGLIRMTQAVLPQMRQQRAGRIINIGSVLGFLPMPYAALYAATKHAVAGYSESLDHEVRSHGVRVIVIEPAYTKTQFDANMIPPDRPIGAYADIRASLAKTIQQIMVNADAPDVVAKAVLKSAAAKQPDLRYTAGTLAGRLRLLRRFAPAKILDRGIRKDLGLDVGVSS